MKIRFYLGLIVVALLAISCDNAGTVDGLPGGGGDSGTGGNTTVKSETHGVGVSPSKISLAVGESQSFVATYVGTTQEGLTAEEINDAGFSWEITKKASDLTSISEKGRLFIGEGEKGQIVVKAISKADENSWGTAVVTFSSRPTKRIFTVNFDLNGGVRGSSSSIAPIQVQDGESVASTLTKPWTNPVNTSTVGVGDTSYHRFDSWTSYPIVDGAEGVVNEDEGGEPWTVDTPITGNILVVANWTIAEKVYATLSFDTDAKSDTPQDLNSLRTGNTLNELKRSLPTPTANPDLYDFKGWYTSKSYSIAFTEDSPITEEKMTLYAKWTNKVFTISFFLEDGTKIGEKTAENNSTITLPETPLKNGWKFGGWIIMDAEEVTFFTNATVVHGDLNLEATWIDDSVKINRITVAFDGYKVEASLDALDETGSIYKYALPSFAESVTVVAEAEGKIGTPVVTYDKPNGIVAVDNSKIQANNTDTTTLGITVKSESGNTTENYVVVLTKQTITNTSNIVGSVISNTKFFKNESTGKWDESHFYTGNGNLKVKDDLTIPSAKILLVAGGGGGGAFGVDGEFKGGGGGGGGLSWINGGVSLSGENIIKVGLGGIGGNFSNAGYGPKQGELIEEVVYQGIGQSGGDTSIIVGGTTYTAVGGGGGGYGGMQEPTPRNGAGVAGGSGGGGSSGSVDKLIQPGAGGADTRETTQGYSGAAGSEMHGTGGGGGGAQSAAILGDKAGSGLAVQAGHSDSGVSTTYYYMSTDNHIYTYSAGGTGGRAEVTEAAAEGAHYGDGGDGASNADHVIGGKGHDGIVIVRWQWVPASLVE
ncbi:MAG: hypothetical protein Ta2G_12480 [Termitinemataceae bacterium]|nr:MAG: hypothetical protein Ta2G_12480 [Termitinemataceae bacterium]